MMNELLLYFAFWFILGFGTLRLSQISMNIGNGSFKNKNLFLKCFDWIYSFFMYFISFYVTQQIFNIGDDGTEINSRPINDIVFITSYLISFLCIGLAYRYKEKITKPIKIFLFILLGAMPVYAAFLIFFHK